MSPEVSQQYEMFIGQLQHEDELVNMRAQWALTLQTLLFGGLGALLAQFNAQLHFEWSLHCQPMSGGVLALSLVGAAIALGARWGVHTAECQRTALCKWWRGLPGHKRFETYFPPFYDHLANPPGRFRASHYFYAIAGFWGLVFVAMFLVAPLPAPPHAGNAAPSADAHALQRITAEPPAVFPRFSR